MKRYLKHFWDFILCFLIGCSLSVNVFAGYDMRDPWSGNLYAVAAAVLFATVVLFFAHFNRFGMRISLPVTVATLITAVAALYYTGAFSGAGSADANPFLFQVIVAAVPIVVFWTARTRAGIFILFLAGTFMTAAFDFLKYPVSIQGYFVMIFGSFALFLHRAQDSLPARAADGFPRPEADRIGPGPASARISVVQPLAISLIAFLLATGIYYGAVKPLSPPTDAAELAQKLMLMKTLEDIGISSKRVIVADKPRDPVTALPDRPEELKKQQTEQDKENREQEKSGEGGRLGNGKNFMDVMAITYKKNADKIRIAAAVAALLLILAFPIKLLLRKKWYADLLKKPNEEGAVELYLCFVKKLKKAGLKRPEGLTLLEYAAASRERLDRFSVYDADFLRLTQIYLKVIYGYQKISDEEQELFHDFYKEFYKNLRAEMGNLGYCMQFFFI